MKRLCGFIFVCTGMIALAPAAQALTLTNRDALEHKFTVIEGDKQSDISVRAGEKIEICLQSCVVRLADGESYEFEGKEIVSLEDGLLFFDEPEQPAKTAP